MGPLPLEPILFNDFAELVKVVTDYAKEHKCRIVSLVSETYSPRIRFIGFKAETESAPIWGIPLTQYKEMEGDARRLYGPYLQSIKGRQKLAEALSWPDCGPSLEKTS